MPVSGSRNLSSKQAKNTVHELLKLGKNAVDFNKFMKKSINKGVLDLAKFYGQTGILLTKALKDQIKRNIDACEYISSAVKKQLKKQVDRAEALDDTLKDALSQLLPSKEEAHDNDPRIIFLTEAAKHVGSGGHAWVQSKTGIGGAAWCAATQCAIAKTVGYAGKIMPGDEYGAGRFGQSVVEKYGGTFIKGGFHGGTTRPAPGDFIEIQNSDGSGSQAAPSGKFASRHIGVVEYVKGNDVHTIEGNHSHSYMRVVRSLSSIAWYARADWGKVGVLDPTVGEGSEIQAGDGEAGSVEGGSSYLPLYETSSTRADARIREVCYMTEAGQPSIKSTGIRLSVINYTNLLAEICSLMGGGTDTAGNSTEDDSSQLGELPRQVFDYCKGRNLNSAASCGILGNIYYESGFKTGSVGDHGTSFGICQWHNERGTKMKSSAGEDWANNLTGQLDYLFTELEAGYRKSVLLPIKAVENTAEGARKAADIFVRKFEVPANVDEQSKKRQAKAEEYFGKIILGSGGGTGASNLLANKKNATVKKSTNVPSSVNQVGIIADGTNYYNWASRLGYTAGKLGKIWISQGCPTRNKLAVIDGLYCIAVRPVFGINGKDVTGSVLRVILEDNTYFDAIAVDAKGADAGNTWGHPYGKGISVVEWYTKGSTSSTSAAWTIKDLGDNLKAAGFYGKKVKTIQNYGSYFDLK